ncbi:tyrosine-type recombinase/integrase [Burkholderia ubonensis]|uniref:tyrosine-type recombinase/integrase n=1 Tax=Burkholderia ubonensis TaxID=101571 RepID=UPI000AAD4A4D|nr:tyrosine-type recombinase/integrase [Burkholderia ubonensis]
MSRAEVAQPTPNSDFWPAQSLDAWCSDPEKSFLAWLAQQRVVGVRQFRDSSRETYASMFSWWLSALADKGLSLLEAAPKDATEFFAASEFEPVSRRRYLQLLDRVYRHLLSVGWKGKNPLTVELLKERELEIALPPGLDEASLTQVIGVLANIPGWKGARDRCAAALLLGAGLRANELIHLRVGEVTELCEIPIKPNGVHREHTTLILPDGPWRGWYRDWEGQRRELAIPGEILCPATPKGAPYSPSGLFRRVSAWLNPLNEGLPQTGPNLLRNTFARQALTCGRYSPVQVQEFLGHEELRATARHLEAIKCSGSGDENLDIC